VKKNISEYLKIGGLTFFMVVGAAYAKAWTNPAMSPPNGNVSAPINISSSTQTKLGSLILNAASPIQNAIGLTVFGTSSFSGALVIADGTQGSGKVLTSDASGNAKWATPASSLGVGQSWTDMTSSRVLGTTYTNSTGKPIAVNIRGTNALYPMTLRMDIDSVMVQGDSATDYSALSIMAVVPSGATYKAYNVSSTSTLSDGFTGGTLRWVELR
jgi:hypothetical protein